MLVASSALAPACDDERREGTTRVGRLHSRGASGAVDARQEVMRTVAELQAAGVPHGTAWCARRSVQQPPDSFYVVIDVPASHLVEARKMGFKTVAELKPAGASLVPLPCPLLWADWTEGRPGARRQP